MPLTLLQFDFPFPGPWGAALAAALRDLAEGIAATPGLRWKIWTENTEEGRAGGIYLFEDAAAADAYRTMHMARLAAFGVADVRAMSFAVNEQLSRIDRAPLD